MNEKDNGPHGVGGWLALLVAGMVVLGPLLSIGRTYGEFAAAEREYPALAQVAEWTSFKTVEWVALLIFCIISIYGGLGLATRRTPDAVSNAKLVLWFNYPISIIVTGMIIPAIMITGSGEEVAMAIPSLIASLIAVGVWTAYLNRSKRVRNTYGPTAPSPIQGASLRNWLPHQWVVAELFCLDWMSRQGIRKSQKSVPSESHSTIHVYTVVDEERVYAEIATELEGAVADKGLWTRLFAECGGDEKQTKVLYIKQRAERLISSERLRLEQAARERAAEVERVEKLRPPSNEVQQMEETA
jgi:hypothetical protein